MYNIGVHSLKYDNIHNVFSSSKRDFLERVARGGIFMFHRGGGGGGVKFYVFGWSRGPHITHTRTKNLGSVFLMNNEASLHHI